MHHLSVVIRQIVIKDLKIISKQLLLMVEEVAQQCNSHLNLVMVLFTLSHLNLVQHPFCRILQQLENKVQSSINPEIVVLEQVEVPLVMEMVSLVIFKDLFQIPIIKEEQEVQMLNRKSQDL
jgi:hypothetical protein